MHVHLILNGLPFDVVEIAFGSQILNILVDVAIQPLRQAAQDALLDVRLL